MHADEFVMLANEAIRTGFTGEITTSTADATAQKLVALQGTSFIRVSMSRSKLLGMIPPANVVPLRNPTYRMPRVSRDRPQTSAGLGETAICADANYFTVTFDERTATPVPHELGLKTTRRFTWDNVEREAAERMLEEEATEQFREDIELSAIEGDTAAALPAGNPPGLPIKIDGWTKKIRTSGNTYWADGAYISENLFHGMCKQLPVERRPNGVAGVREAGYQFFAPVDVVDEWALRVSKRETGAGDVYLLEDGRPAWRGIPINGVPHFPTNLNGVAGHAVSNVASSFCYLWLLKLADLYVYYNPVLFIHRGLEQQAGKIMYYYLYSALDVQVSVPENCVIARDVRPTYDTTAW